MCAISQGVPGWAALLIFLVVLFLLGVMEGIQVSGFTLAFPITKLSRLLWLSSSDKIQRLTKKVILGLTGG